MGAPNCIAVDWISRTLYIGNMGLSTIEVIRLDGDQNYRKVLLSNNGSAVGVAKPVSMAVDPIQG